MKNDSPYAAPCANLTDDSHALRRRGRWLAATGVALFSGPAWGMLVTAFAMMRAFNTLEVAGEAETAAVLAEDISLALMATMVGLIVGLVGVVLILIALFGVKNRERWFFNWSVVLAIIWCLVLFPYGLVVGVPVLILFISRRLEFARPSLLPTGQP